MSDSTKADRPLVTRVHQTTLDTLDRLANVCGVSRSELTAIIVQAAIERLKEKLAPARPTPDVSMGATVPFDTCALCEEVPA